MKKHCRSCKAHKCGSFSLPRVCWTVLTFIGVTHVPISSSPMSRTQLATACSIVACVASVSMRVRQESWDECKKRGKSGDGKGENKTLARKMHDFEKLHSPTNTASDWCGAGSVDYIAINSSIKPGVLFLSSLIWFLVADYKYFGLIFIWIVFVRRLIRSESL